MVTTILILLAIVFATGMIGWIYFATTSGSITWMILFQQNAMSCLEGLLSVLGALFSDR